MTSHGFADNIHPLGGECRQARRLGCGLPGCPRVDRHQARQRSPHPLNCRRALAPPHPPRYRRELATSPSGGAGGGAAGGEAPAGSAGAADRAGTGAPGDLVALRLGNAPSGLLSGGHFSME